MIRRPLIAGNWKMFKKRAEAEATVRELLELLEDTPEVEIVLCPPFTALGAVGNLIKGSAIGLGAQNVHWEEEGAFTGEVSAPMLLDYGCRYVIIGHSERRQYFHESDRQINLKLKKVLGTKLVPILCIGESLEEREANRVDEIVLGQLRQDLDGLGASGVARMVLAYEPVWAIGTGKTATPELAAEVHRMIRQWLSENYSQELAAATRILYGGSVKPENTAELMAQEDIDGALVGGASLNAGSFARIVSECGGQLTTDS